MKLPKNGQRVRRRRMWKTLSRGTRDCLRETSFAHTTRIATEARSVRVKRRLGTKSTAAAAAGRRKAESSEGGFGTDARPSLVATTSSCRASQQRETTCATRSAGRRRTGAGGAAGARSNPVTISS